MISAYVEQAKPVPARIVEAVSKELDLQLKPMLDSAMDRVQGLEGIPGSGAVEFNQPLAFTTESIKESEL